MGKDTFLLFFVSGAGTLAAWVAIRLPKLAPRDFRVGTVHLVAAMVVGAGLSPALQAIPGLPATAARFAALFLVALPAITYMLLVGMWLVQLAAANGAPGRR
jgi:hypothetical protein